MKQGNSNIESAVDKQRKYATNRTTYNEQPSGFNCDNTFSHRRYHSGTDKVLSSKQELTNLNERADCEINPDSIMLPDNNIEDYIPLLSDNTQQQIYPRYITTQATPDTLTKPNLLSNDSDRNIPLKESLVVSKDTQEQIYPRYYHHTATQATPDTLTKPNLLSNDSDRNIPLRESLVVSKDTQEQIYPRYYHHTATQATPDTLTKPNLLSNDSDRNIPSISVESKVTTGFTLRQSYPIFTSKIFDGSIAGPEELQTNQGQNNNPNAGVTPANVPKEKCNII